jgi:DNA-directed RNA polymerase specialized sigma24 family protein
VVQTKEFQSCVRAALHGLPGDAQRALMLHYVVGLRGKELARSLRKPEGEVDRLIERARTELRQKLLESGCTLRPHEPARA